MDWWRIVLQHGWRLLLAVLLIPLWIDVPAWVQYGCAALVVLWLVWDLVQWRQERRTPAA